MKISDLDGEGRVVGVISLNDLARHAARQRGPGASKRAAVAETLGRVNAPRAPAVAVGWSRTMRRVRGWIDHIAADRGSGRAGCSEDRRSCP